MSYTGDLPKTLDVSEPAIGTARVSELDDAIRQVKRALIYGHNASMVSAGDVVIPDTTGIFIYNGGGGNTLTLPEISNMADTTNGIDICRSITIINAASGNITASNLDVDAGGSDTLAKLITLWKGESATVICEPNTTEWQVILSSQGEHIKKEYIDHGTKSAAYTIYLDTALVHLVNISAAMTLTFDYVDAKSSSYDRAMVIIKHDTGTFTITLSGINNLSPTLSTVGTVQDALMLVRSFGKITCAGFAGGQSAS